MRTTRPQCRARGAALLLTLWCVAVVSLSVVLVARVVDADVTDESLRAKRFEARQAALTGISFGLNPAIARGSALLRQEFSDGSGLDVRVISESGRLNINRLLQSGNPRLLNNLFRRWGVSEIDAAVAVDSLADWVDADDAHRLNGAERDNVDATVHSPPRNREFLTVEEMARVRGMDAVARCRPDWRTFFSVFSGDRLDLQDAPADLLEVVGGLTGAQARALVSYRAGRDGIEGTADDVLLADLAQAAAAAGLSEAQAETLGTSFQIDASPTRIESTGWQSGAKYHIAVVALRAPDKSINLSWEEQ